MVRKMQNEKLVQYALEEGFYAAGVIDTEEIVFDPSFRPYCEENLCGQYGVNYSCPPDCGTPEEMKERILKYKHALVFQTVWPIFDYTDKKAIKQAKAEHNAAAMRVIKRLREEGCNGLMVGASGCSLCSPCALTVGEPCRYPELKFSCVSAYCIFARKLAESCGMEYDCGEKGLAFFGMYVYEER